MKNIFHIHSFNTPIASKYIGFNTRNIIFECRCGKRKVKQEYRSFGEAFSMPTSNFMSDEMFKAILNYKQDEK